MNAIKNPINTSLPSLVFHTAVLLAERSERQGDGPRVMTEDDRSPLRALSSLSEDCDIVARVKLPVKPI
jgi:hypothetical protein